MVGFGFVDMISDQTKELLGLPEVIPPHSIDLFNVSYDVAKNYWVYS